MSRIPNADASLLAFCRICNKDEYLFGPRLAAIRKKYAASPFRKLLLSVDYRPTRSVREHPMQDMSAGGMLWGTRQRKKGF